MTRNTAREIATHLAYELSFNDLPVEAFLDTRLSEESFEGLAAEHEIYGDKPNQKQLQYIRRLVSGVAEHAAELDTYIENYAQGWRFERISLVASAIMRVAMFEILYMPDNPMAWPSTRLWRSPRSTKSLRLPSLSTVFWAASCVEK